MIEEKRVLHGVYIRVSGDTGNVIGAHVEWVDRVVRDGEVIHAKMTVEPLEPAADVLTPLIGEAVRELSAELERVRAENDALREALAQADEPSA